MQAAQLFPDEVTKIQQYFSLENKKSNVRVPIAEGMDMPLYILGSSTDSAYLAATKGFLCAFASHFASTHLLNALKIYQQEFQPASVLDQPYAMAGINVFIADTDAEAEQLFTSMIRMFIGVLTGARQPLQPPTEMTPDLQEVLQHPSLHAMLKYSFVGSKSAVKNKIREFLLQAEVDELIAVSAMYNIQDRLKSVRVFAEIMNEINNE
jgi:luciferase family oxidoreductase group 1